MRIDLQHVFALRDEEVPGAIDSDVIRCGILADLRKCDHVLYGRIVKVELKGVRALGDEYVASCLSWSLGEKTWLEAFLVEKQRVRKGEVLEVHFDEGIGVIADGVEVTGICEIDLQVTHF